MPVEHPQFAGEIIRKYTLSEQILADLPEIKFPPKLSFFVIRQICFCFRKLSSSIYTVDYRYFEHRAISNKSLKNMKRQRMRDKNYSLFISLLKLVNFNNTFAPLLYF